MKTILIAVIMTLFIQYAPASSWEVVGVTAEQFQAQRIKLTITAKNTSGIEQHVQSSRYDSQRGYGHAMSYLWPSGETKEKVLSAVPTHYPSHNSLCCHDVPENKPANLIIPPDGEVKFVIFDTLSTVGKRLIIRATSPFLGQKNEGSGIIGVITVPAPKKEE